MSGEGFTDARRPLDTSTLGPIRVEPNAECRRAELVRNALNALAPECRSRGAIETGDALAYLAEVADDAALAKLGRLLKC